jgi:predicted DsbA family dithiol-disulfide isomerase/uncharacterized membrane protein
MITRSLSNNITQGLAAVGSILAALLTFEHYNSHFSLPCGMPGSAGCSGALNSAYGHLGPIPTAIFGLGMYVLLIVLCNVRRNRLDALRAAEAARAAAYAAAGIASIAEPRIEAAHQGTASQSVTELPPTQPVAAAGAPMSTPLPYPDVRQVDMAIWGLTLLGTGISWWLQYTSFFVLWSFCPYCFTSAILITLCFLLACRDFLLDGRKLTGEQKMLAFVGVFIAALMLLMRAPDVVDQWAKIHKPNAKPITHRENGMDFDRTSIVRADMHIMGDPKAPYLIVEFADYMCPNCKETGTYLKEEMKDDRIKSKLRLAFRNFPLAMHKWSSQAAEAAEAADAQGKFWQMHDYLFEHQEEMEAHTFTPEHFLDFAREVGLDVEKFKMDMLGHKYKARVDADMADGHTNGLYSTPTIFIVPPGNKKIWRVMGREELEKLLQDPNHPAWK